MGAALDTSGRVVSDEKKKKAVGLPGTAIANVSGCGMGCDGSANRCTADRPTDAQRYAVFSASTASSSKGIERANAAAPLGTISGVLGSP